MQQSDYADSRTEELNLNHPAPAYSQPAFAEAHPVDDTPTTSFAEPEAEPVAVANQEESKDKRGTLSFGLLLLRLLVGGLLLVQGLQYLFAFGGNAGLNVLERSLDGYTAPDILAVGLSVGAVVAGALLILGLLTPFGAALGAVVAGFFAVHHLSTWDGGLFPATLDGTTQMWALLAGMSMIVVFTGPGRAALDRSRSWATRPLASAWVFAIVAVAGLVGLWLLVGGGNPLN